MIWHHGVYVNGEPYPTRHPMPDRFRAGKVTITELMGLPEDQMLAAKAAHELGHALLWLAGGLRVSHVSIIPGSDLGGHAMTLPTGTDDEARRRVVGAAGGERAEDRWLREAGLWTPDRAAVVEAAAASDRAYVLKHTTPRPQFGTGDEIDYVVLHDIADEALDQVWDRLRIALPVLVRRRVMSGEQLAACVGLPFPQVLVGR